MGPVPLFRSTRDRNHPRATETCFRRCSGAAHTTVRLKIYRFLIEFGISIYRGLELNVLRLVIIHLSSWPSVSTCMSLLVAGYGVMECRAAIPPDTIEVYLHFRAACVVIVQAASIRGGLCARPFFWWSIVVIVTYCPVRHNERNWSVTG